MSDGYKLGDHIFIHSSEGWVCEKCSRRWCNVVAGQPSWPKHDHSLGVAPLSEGIACVGNTNADERRQFEAEKQRIWAAVCDAAGYGLGASASADPE